MVLSPSCFPHLENEIALQRQGYCRIAGLDEAGRGAWAGPVVAGAVVLPLHRPDLAVVLAGLNDSKKLSPAGRDHFFEVIQAVALAVGVGVAEPEEVDRLNVVGATRLAMERALNRLDLTPDYLLLDHLRLPAVALPQAAFPRADAISLTVAAASVVAKVTRDRVMVRLSETYPQYQFHEHKGYGTPGHQRALARYGPCNQHRFSFQPVKELQPLEADE